MENGQFIFPAGKYRGILRSDEKSGKHQGILKSKGILMGQS